MLCIGLAYLPVAALVDYELTLTKPSGLSADTGIDALTHAIEAYVSRKSNLFSDGLALQAMHLIAEPAPGLDRSQRPGGREAMMLGATQAGIAFSNASVALVHGMSRPIGRAFPRGARALERDAAAGGHRLLGPRRAGRATPPAPGPWASPASTATTGSAVNALVAELEALNDDLDDARSRDTGSTRPAGKRCSDHGPPRLWPPAPRPTTRLGPEEIQRLYRRVWAGVRPIGTRR